MLHVLCLSEQCRDILSSLGLAQLRLVALGELEAAFPDLARVKSQRRLVEYYFTLTPFWPLYLLENDPGVERVVYLDSDLWFFSSPAPLLAEQGDASVSLVPHRFPERLRGKEAYGKYNVGWLSFRRDAQGLEILRWYRDRCMEWCYDRWEEGRFADQKYLDALVESFGGVHVLGHPGANLAPWNVDRHAVTGEPGNVRVDGDPLIFYHFHGLCRLFGPICESGLGWYCSRLTPTLRQAVYAPYLQELGDVARVVETTVRERMLPGAPDLLSTPWHSRFSGGRASDVLRLVKGAFAGSLVMG